MIQIDLVLAAFVLCDLLSKLVDIHYFFFFLAVFAARLKFFAVGAPLLPGFLIFSPEPAAIRLRLAWMFEYNPVFWHYFLSPFNPLKPNDAPILAYIAH